MQHGSEPDLREQDHPALRGQQFLVHRMSGKVGGGLLQPNVAPDIVRAEFRRPMKIC